MEMLKKFWPVIVCGLLGAASFIGGIIAAIIFTKFSFFIYGCLAIVVLYAAAFVLFFKIGSGIAGKVDKAIRMPDTNMGVEEKEKN